MKYYAIIVEGRTDSALIEAMLEKEFGFKAYTNKKDLPNVFMQMMGKYPQQTGELKPTGFPLFYYTEEIGITIRIANGNTKIAANLEGLLDIVENCEALEDFNGFIIITDKDTKSQDKIIAELNEQLNKINLNFSPEENSITNENAVKTHLWIYIVPQKEHGAIEKLLLSCAGKICENNVYCLAEKVRNKLNEDGFSKIRRSWGKMQVQDFYADKVQLGVISAILKPDKTIAMTVKDKLIRKEFLAQLKEVDEYNLLYEFLKSKLS
ncbi:DUF3226 domain-containing protein [Megamonas hypermegale]|uniref:DUF3226 domain-containing protein n=1 Tax=Megamonas hypermegale TaxID=158847 RepID=UPI0026F30F3A|nr:DUF3226 domain-containing protein [Megamonas hypermegale]